MVLSTNISVNHTQGRSLPGFGVPASALCDEGHVLKLLCLCRESNGEQLLTGLMGALTRWAATASGAEPDTGDPGQI